MEFYDVEPFLLLPAVLDLRPLVREPYLGSRPVGAAKALQWLITQVYSLTPDPPPWRPLCSIFLGYSLTL